MKFLSREITLYLCKSIIRNTVVMSRRLLPTTTWICWINYKNGYVRLLLLLFLPLLNPWLIVEI